MKCIYEILERVSLKFRRKLGRKKLKNKLEFFN
jgi:hypothetical protein